MKVLTTIEIRGCFGGASTLHRAGTQTRSGSTVASQEEEERRARAENSMAGAEKKVIRQSARARWRDPNTCSQAERGPRAPSLLNPAAPAGSLSIPGLRSDLVLQTRCCFTSADVETDPEQQLSLHFFRTKTDS